MEPDREQRGQDSERGPGLSAVYKQMQRVVVCQICGRAKERQAALDDGWLVAPWRKRRRDEYFAEADVVRCYRHISIHSLRVSFAGRTRYWMAKMAEGQQRLRDNPDLPFSVMAEPFPHTDRLLEDIPEDAIDPTPRRPPN